MAWATLRAVNRLGIAVLCLSTVDMPMRVLAGELYASNQEMLALFQNGEYEASIAVAERAVAEAKNAYGDNRPEYAIQLGKLAHSLMAANRISDAEPLLRRALQICSTALAPDHPMLADVLDGMATAALWQGRLEEAEELLKRVYAIREQRIAADDPSFSISSAACRRFTGCKGGTERANAYSVRRLWWLKAGWG
jgi:tetratricopeptide (TPR) repeat protein